MSQRERLPSDSAPGGRKKWRYAALFGGSTLWISILIHVLFAAAAAYVVVEHFTVKHIDFHATEPPTPSTSVEHKVELAKKNNVESAPPDLKRITTTDLAPIALPDVPMTPPTAEDSPSAMAGDATMGMGMGAGAGAGSGTGGGTPVFGAVDGAGLKGFLYDLKQTPKRQPTHLKYEEYYIILDNYLDHDWDDSILDKYFKGETPLYATRMAISMRPSSEAPKAFRVEKVVEPKFWAVAYHGKVTAPEGDYQFVGFADNVLVVRVNGQLVLDAGWNLLKKNTPELHQNITSLKWSNYCEGKYAGHYWLKKGPVFHMKAGDAVDMDVLIGDDGGECGFFLQVRKVDNPLGPTPDDTWNLPFFQLGDDAAPSFGGKEIHPPYSTVIAPWQSAD